MNRFSFWPRSLALVGVSLLLLAAGACERIAPVRTLPSWVRGVYVPMIKNKTVEPQIEETITRLTEEAFLTDGRVDVVPRQSADLTLVVTITGWESRVSNTSGDHVASDEEVTVTADVKLYEPFDMSKPLADLGPLRVNSGFNIDTRSTSYEVEPDRKERLLRQLADQIVFRTLNGFPTTLRNLPPGVSLPEVRTPEAIVPEEPLSNNKGSLN